MRCLALGFAHRRAGRAYAYGTASDTLQGAKIYNGVGFGVRWRSPVGPVNLDLGYGIERHQFRPNISLGVAF